MFIYNNVKALQNLRLYTYISPGDWVGELVVNKV